MNKSPTFFVPAKAIMAIIECMETLGHSPDPVVEALPVTRQELYSQQPEITWDVLVKIMDNIQARYGSLNAISEFAKVGPRIGLHAGLNRVMGLFTDPKWLYWTLCKWAGPNTFPGIVFHFLQREKGHIQVTIRVPEDIRISIPFFYSWKGIFTTMPSALAQPDSLVEMQIDSSGRLATYEILPPPSLTLWSRARKAWKVIFSAHQVVEELAHQQEQVVQYFQERLKAQQEAFDTKKQLEFSAQIAGLAQLSAVGEMAGGLAHEINNPLTIINLHLHRLKLELDNKDTPPAQLQRRIESIEETLDRISKIIRGLREFARNADQDPFEKTKISRVLEDTFQLCSERLRSRDIKLEIRIDDREAILECRPIQISQALLNLINNSYDAVLGVLDRRIRIQVVTGNEEVQIRVSDSGLGVPVEIRDKLFHPFFTTKKVGAGTGLGLSISRGFLQSHHGELYLDTSAVKTTFVMRLPRTQPESDASPRKALQG